MTKLFTFFLLFFVSTSVFSLDYYWVGGTGNWSDFANHWATTSGGATFHAQVPTLNDNVYFDANSFTSAGQTVTNDQTIIYCRDMDWSATTNNPTFAGPSSNDLKIYGSLIFSNNMTISYAGEIYFEATSIGKTITMAGQSFGAYIYFNGIGGGWEFTDAFQSSTWVHLVHGTVTTNDNQVTVGAMYASANNPMTLNLGASLVTITGSTWAWWVNNSSFTLNAGTSLLRLTSASSPDIRYANNLNFYDVEFTDPNTTAEIISSNNSSFNSVTFMGNGKINGSHSYNNLNFSAGKLYELASGATQTVTTLNANGTCTEYITIKSSSVGAQTTIAKASGAVSIDFVQLQDIAASGGATFTANNAVDLGNNTGWTINTSAARNLYWVGDAGDWTDASHWSISSGGTGGNCPPTFQDNVYFDANSFATGGQTVSIDANASCNDMDWTGVSNNPTFAGANANNLSIYGSLTFAAAMNRTYAGLTYFEATSIGKTITMAGQSFSAYAYFNGIGGGWEFTDAFQSSTWVHLVHGTVTTNDNQVTVGAFYASSNNPMTLNLGASLVTITGSTWAWWVNNSSFVLNAGTSMVRLTSPSSPDIRNANNLSFYDVEFTDPNTTAEIISSNNSSFNSVTFLGNGKINGSHSYNNLNFSAGKLYELASGATQTVTTLNANGTCTEYITIKSSSVGAQTTIAKASGAVSIDFVQLQDISASGGATFTANNAVDLGNNTGWTINTSAARNLYWVGDAGDWTDASHWSISSGGTGGNCPPTFQDNVYFDANSFTTGGQTVTIDANASCNDMDWTGVSNNPTFAGANANNLSIYGSLTFAAAMNRTYAGLTYFEATSIGKTITMAGQSFSAYAYFNGIGGGWEFTDAFQSSTWVHLVHGTVTTNDNQVTVGAFYASSNNPMTLNLGASLVTITGSTWAWWVNNSSFTLNAGTSMVRLTSPSSPDIRYANNLNFYDVEFTDPNTTAEIISSNNSSFNSVTFMGNGKINGSHSYNTITFSPGRTYTLQANSTQSIINSFNARGTGGFPIEFLSTSPGVQANFSMANGVVCTEYLFLRDNNATGGATWRAENSTDNGNVSGWIFGPCSLLPIDLISFEGAAEVGKNQLLWTTSSEEQSDYFVLEKSADGYSWSVLEEIQTVGNSAALQYYSYADAQPFEITYYRLRLVDNDLTAAYSDVIVLHNVSVVGQSGIKIYPNPAKSNLYINSPQKIENVEIRILNNIGQKVWTRRLYLEGTQQLDLSQLEAGVHTILILKKETIMVEKFVRIE